MAPLLPKLRGHFAEFLNESSLARLRILFPPTCVGLGYGHHQRLEILSRTLLPHHRFPNKGSPCECFRILAADFPICASSTPNGHFQPSACFTCAVIPITIALGGTGVFNLFPIAYAFPPQLRGRLTQGRRALPWKPWVFGEGDSHPLCRYLCHASSLACAPTLLTVRLLRTCNALLPLPFLLNGNP